MFNKCKKYLTNEKIKGIAENIRKLKEYIYIKKNGKDIFNYEITPFSLKNRTVKK
jgi:hypothetical protein